MRKFYFASVDLLVLNLLKNLKLKSSSSELGSKPLFNLCILLNDPSKTMWKHVDFESFQLSALSNQTPLMCRHLNEQANGLSLGKTDSQDFLFNNQFLCIWGGGGIKHFKDVCCQFKFRNKFDVLGVGLSSVEGSKVRD